MNKPRICVGRGFTLIELLLVLAIIALAIVIFIPSTPSNQDTGQKLHLSISNGKEVLVVHVGDYIEVRKKADMAHGALNAGIWRLVEFYKSEKNNGSSAILIRGMEHASKDDSLGLRIVRPDHHQYEPMISLEFTAKQLEANMNNKSMSYRIYGKDDPSFKSIDDGFRWWDDKLRDPRVIPLDAEKLPK